MFSSAVYALSHFAVDLGCAYSYFANCTCGSTGFLIYNFCAFALQMPLGLLADRFGHGKQAAMVGCAITALLCCLPGFGLAGAAVLGIGNALFHVGAGIEVMHRSHRAAPLGVFVSPGAFGLYLGTLLGKHGASPLPALLTLLAVLILIAFVRPVWFGYLLKNTALPRRITLFAALLFVVVVIRSFAGMTGAFPWKQGSLAIAAVICVVLGKALGGFAADRFGAAQAGTISLLAAGICFIFSADATAGLAALLLFNMSMPITLHKLAEFLPDRKGFSFGMLTFALFLGFVPTYLGIESSTPLVLAVCSIGSACMLFPALRQS